MATSTQETTPSRTPPRRRGGRLRPATVLRVLVTAALLYLVARQVSWEDLRRSVTDVDFRWMALSLAVSPVLILLNALRWRALLRGGGADPGLAACFRLHLAGNFYNQVLPTGMGGDVMRAWMLGRHTGRWAEATASVFLERLCGVIVLVLLAAAALTAAPGRFEHPAIRILAGGAAAASLLIVWATLDRRVGRLLGRCGGRWIGGKLARFQSAVDSFRSRPRALTACLAVSVAFHFTAALNVLFTVRTFRQDLALGEAVLATPVIFTVALFPLSLGGLGIAEWAYLTVLGPFGVSPAPALSAALFLRVKGLVMGLIGGVEGLLGGIAAPAPASGPEEPGAQEAGSEESSLPAGEVHR